MTGDRSRLRMWRRSGPEDGRGPAIPLHMAIGYGGDHHDDNTVEHETHLEVVGAPETHTTAIVQSDAHADPRVLRYVRVGALAVSREVLDWVFLIAFNKLIYEMTRMDGDAADFWVGDAAEWLGRRLSLAHAAAAVAALAPHVKVGRADVLDLVWVRQE